MRKSLLAPLAAGAALGAIQPAFAAVIWADLTDKGSGTVSGTVGDTTVSYSGAYQFAQTSGGTDFWNGASKSSWNGTSAVSNTDLIALTTGGLKTINFGRVVSEVYIALLSWNGNTATFSDAFTVEPSASGASCGYWGCGTAGVSADNKTFIGNGEFHGILKFTDIMSLTFLDTSEYWHGIQIGIGSGPASVPPPATHMPEPTTWGMMIFGMTMVGAAMRRRPKLTVRFA